MHIVSSLPELTLFVVKERKIVETNNPVLRMMKDLFILISRK